MNLGIAAHLAELSERHGVPIIFKASFDKANRTSRTSHRGPGLERGMELLAGVKAETGLSLLTRQTDLLEAAGGSGLPVNIKKGQWMAPEQMAHAVDKVRAAGARDVAVTERGTAFGYGRWIVDMRSFEIMRVAASCPTIFDGTRAGDGPFGFGKHAVAGPAGCASGAAQATAPRVDRRTNSHRALSGCRFRPRWRGRFGSSCWTRTAS